MLNRKSMLLGAACALLMTTAAAAQEPPVKDPAQPAAPESMEQTDDGPFDLSFNVGVSNDYRFRGISQTDEQLQVFGGADLTHESGFYAGVWASNIDYTPFGDDDTDAEIDIYAGIKPEFGGYTFDFAGIYYTYLNQPDFINELNYFEAKAAVSRAYGPATVGGALYYSPEFSGELGDAVYYEVNGAYTLNDRVSFSGVLGRQQFSDFEDFDYTTYNVGVTYALGRGVSLDLRFHDTADLDNAPDPYDPNVVGTIKAVF